MRPTGQLHLGHYHGVLKNWLALQNEYDSYFFVADWHAFGKGVIIDKSRCNSACSGTFDCTKMVEVFGLMPLTTLQFFREFKFELNFVLENSKVVKIVTIVPSVFNCLCKLQ
jgi:hypothetical protein